MREVIVKISRDGSKVETTVEGVTGPACEDITKSLLEALGEVEESKKTPEYFMQDLSVVSNNI